MARSSPSASSLPYRPCVGILVLNRHNRVWLGRRRRKYLTVRGTKADAQRMLRELLSALDRGVGNSNLPTGNTPFVDLPDLIRYPRWGENERGDPFNHPHPTARQSHSDRGTGT